MQEKLPFDLAWSVIDKILSEDANFKWPPSTLILQADLNETLQRYLNKYRSKNIEIYQSFRSIVNKFKAHGYKTEQELSKKFFDLVLFVPTRQRQESLALLAHALLHLNPEGKLLFVCENSQGAGGYLSRLQELAPELQAESAKKCRWLWIQATDIKNKDLLETWLKEGAQSTVPNSTFQSFPGIYGWNKVDKGSELLISTLTNLSGRGADLGSGYGYLSQNVLKNFPDVTHMTLVEADYRALQCARLNLYEFKDRCDFYSLDVTAPECPQTLQNYDFVIMNPPFHEGNNTDHNIGKAFIDCASEIIKEKGSLFMVANSFLAYEDLLKIRFRIVNRVLLKDGFKVIHAQR